MGIFPESRTRCCYNISLPSSFGALTAVDFVRSFRTTMSEMYPDDKIRPRLKKIMITITLP